MNDERGRLLFCQIRVLEQEKKISELEEANRDPEREETDREDEINKLQALVEVSKQVLYTDSALKDWCIFIFGCSSNFTTIGTVGYIRQNLHCLTQNIVPS